MEQWDFMQFVGPVIDERGDAIGLHADLEDRLDLGQHRRGRSMRVGLRVFAPSSNTVPT